ncbi:DUF2167 domain-containing protein [Paracoccus litorisediminis]|uniref:DUF2167 domain-containing protein n=1 Tax=Paracoccus litorisediminis TaxID=2006130 RepID=UPI0037333ACB
MIKLRNFLKEQVVILAVSFAAFTSEPAILNAQTPPDGTHFFTGPLMLSRGSFQATSPEGLVLEPSYYCDILVKEWGWSSCDHIDGFAVATSPGVDSLIIEKPNSDGYVTFDDWDKSDRDSEIKSIEESLHKSLVAQGQKTGQTITFIAWRMYPELIRDKHALVYATDIAWNGDVTTNIKVVLFDRGGYVPMAIVPMESNLSSLEIRGLVESVIDSYHANATTDYTSYVTGDKVAAVGVVGVLAGVLGIKYGKAAAVGIAALAAAFAKKFFFLLFLPFLAIGKLFKRKKNS